MRGLRFTEDVHFKVPEGLLAQVRKAADEAGMTASEFMRGAIRGRLEADGRETWTIQPT